MELIIENLSKTYSNGVQALQNISLEIPNGMFGLLGPNGAGKSTLMRTIATLQEADKGSIKLGNLDVLKQKNDIRKILGYLPQQFGLYPKISAEVLLNHFAVLKGITNKGERKEIVESLLHKTNLYKVRKQNLHGFSGGMKQRFGIAQALLNSPKLLIVDEPTAGLDPLERNRFYNILSEIGENTVVILSTHIVEDVKELCTNMAIINQGQVLLKGNPVQIIDSLKGRVYEKTIQKEELKSYKQAYHVISEKLFLGKPIINILSESNPNNGFTPVKASLEDVYFSQIFGANNQLKQVV
ncbi:MULTISPECIES: ABC transporter ATP-binding protein [unclassified Tenacibaculum]|uniref:ABC transporter ATP-binding protein n=1 Tax=unclassified Tenacibaculum TaxID=2635139 RepID=UPI001F3E8070|nr:MULTISPECIES: ABC transporter ATP-binding protein [unclassified Tenacibaculum]MCF2875796.1 ABC transporter ATP-binding protein [Tenacibaculum sp. Cn5-1]MCF2935871.1 ABC transporter ATP-binding protein [Tenacibaculum sp. Cn5-34]MCG7512432.1 ABC transporter ATP-binding protein [Tenacibaculum sp. Cn5-46]